MKTFKRKRKKKTIESSVQIVQCSLDDSNDHRIEQS